MNPRPPGPTGARGALAFPMLAADPLSFFADIPKRYGPIALVPIGKERLVILTEPALVEEVLLRRARKVGKNEITRRLSETLGDGLLTSEGETWRHNRRQIAPSFQRGELQGYAAVMAQRAIAWAEAVRPGVQIDLHAEMGALTLGIVAETLFGAANVDRTHEIQHALEGLMQIFELRLRTWRRFAPRSFYPRLNRAVAKNNATIDRVLWEIIRAHQKPHQRPDLLARLQEARDEEGVGFTDQQLRDEAITLFLAGHETTALGLTYALRLLAMHPERAARLRDELSGKDPTMADLPSLPYLTAVIKETLRLYPPAWSIGRQALEDMILGGYQIRKGDGLIVVQWSMHRDGRWFVEPTAFRPERWLDGLEARLPPYTYLPFGGGPRICIGNHFAMTELCLTLAAIVRRWQWTLREPTALALTPSVTLRPKTPIWATPTPIR